MNANTAIKIEEKAVDFFTVPDPYNPNKIHCYRVNDEADIEYNQMIDSLDSEPRYDWGYCDPNHGYFKFIPKVAKDAVREKKAELKEKAWDDKFEAATTMNKIKMISKATRKDVEAFGRTFEYPMKRSVETNISVRYIDNDNGSPEIIMDFDKVPTKKELVEYVAEWAAPNREIYIEARIDHIHTTLSYSRGEMVCVDRENDIWDEYYEPGDWWEIALYKNGVNLIK